MKLSYIKLLRFSTYKRRESAHPHP
jgi:hypothetical protein